MVEELDDADAGLLFKHYLRYINDQNPEPPTKLIKIVFEPIKQSLKRDLKKWDEKIQSRSKAGSIGAESKWGNTDNHLLRSQRLSIAKTKGTHTSQQWKELLGLCDNKCVICGDVDIVKDHIVPIYQGGSDGITNLQPLCKSCNSRKGRDSTNHLLLYFGKMPGKIKDAYQSLAKMAVNVTDTVTVTVKDNDICINTKIFGFDSKYYFLIDSKYITDKLTRVNGVDGFNEYMESNQSVLNLPAYAEKFMRKHNGAKFNDFMHVFNAYNKFTENGNA